MIYQIVISCFLQTYSSLVLMNTYIPQTSCIFFYYLSGSNFTFQRCQTSLQITNWENCITLCCRNIPPSNFSIPDFGTLVYCKQGATKYQTSTVVIIFVAALSSVFTVLIIILLVIIVRTLHQSYTEMRIPRRALPLEWPSQRHNITIKMSQIKWVAQQKNTHFHDDQTLCCICLDENSNTLLYCGHHYHLRCIQRWLQQSSFCPLCHRQGINTLKVVCSSCNKFYFLAQIEFISQNLQNISYQCENCIKNRSRMRQLYQENNQYQIPIHNSYFLEDVSTNHINFQES